MTWPTVLLDSVTTRGSGHTPSQKFPEYWDGGIKWVSLADSSALDKRYIYKTARTVSALGIRHSSAVLHPKGTVIVSRDAGVGKSAILGDEMAVSQHFIAWRCDPTKLHPEYLYQWLQSNKCEFERMAVGSTIKTIGLGYFEKLRIPLPPIDVQRTMATILDVWDVAVEKTEQLIAAKEHFLAGVRQELFRKSRGVRNREWKSVRLSEVLTEHRRKCTGNENVFSVSVHKGLVNQIEHLGRSFAASDTSNYNRVLLGDIVYTKSPTGDFPFGIVKQNKTKADVIVSPLYGVFSPVTQELGLLIDFYFESPTKAGNYLRPLIQKGAKNTISITNSGFLSGKLNLPISLGEQKRIAQFVTEARNEIALLRVMKAGYDDQKRGLMQKLLTGQWRVKLLETEAA